MHLNFNSYIIKENMLPERVGKIQQLMLGKLHDHCKFTQRGSMSLLRSCVFSWRLPARFAMSF